MIRVVVESHTGPEGDALWRCQKGSRSPQEDAPPPPGPPVCLLEGPLQVDQHLGAPSVPAPAQSPLGSSSCVPSVTEDLGVGGAGGENPLRAPCLRAGLKETSAPTSPMCPAWPLCDLLSLHFYFPEPLAVTPARPCTQPASTPVARPCEGTVSRRRLCESPRAALPPSTGWCFRRAPRVAGKGLNGTRGGRTVTGSQDTKLRKPGSPGRWRLGLHRPAPAC